MELDSVKYDFLTVAELTESYSECRKRHLNILLRGHDTERFWATQKGRPPTIFCTLILQEKDWFTYIGVAIVANSTLTNCKFKQNTDDRWL